MKSKKIIALALTAAIAISAASMTAFAKSVTYNTATTVKNPENRIATVVVNKDDKGVYTKSVPTEYKATETFTIGTTSFTKDTTTITADEYKVLVNDQDKFEVSKSETVYYIKFKDIGLEKYERTITKQQFGWIDAIDADVTAIGNADKDTTANSQWTTDKDPSKKKDVYKDDSEIELGDDTKFDGNGDLLSTAALKFQTVGRTDTDNDNIKENQKAIDAAASKDKAAKNREEELEKLDVENKATDNVNKGDGIETKQATVSDPVAAYEANSTGKAGDPKDGNGAVTLTSGGHDFKVAGLELNKSNLAWLYYVEKPDGLINGKNARAQLKLPDGYTTSGFKATVYHIKGWCSAEKVKGVNVGTNDVAFWANDFSPYVLVLTPKDAVAGTSTGNPSTGDFSAVPVAMLAAAALGATGFVAYKKRKAE